MDWIAALTLINTVAVIVLGVLIYRLSRREKGTFPGDVVASPRTGPSRSGASAAPRPTLVRSGTTLRLLVENIGQGEARDVRIGLEGASLEEHPLFVEGQPAGASGLGPGSRIELLLAPSHDTPPPPYLVELRWEDDSGSGRSFRTQVS